MLIPYRILNSILISGGIVLTTNDKLTSSSTNTSDQVFARRYSTGIMLYPGKTETNRPLSQNHWTRQQTPNAYRWLKNYKIKKFIKTQTNLRSIAWTSGGGIYCRHRPYKFVISTQSLPQSLVSIPFRHWIILIIE